jgi:transcriptional regulator with GAF, ATPase, and Fis domain
VELQRNLDAIRQQGLGLAAISYDSVAVLKNFTDRQHRGAAARLGLKRTSLAYKMQKLGISRLPK